LIVIHKDDDDRITIGMSRDQVHSILGPSVRWGSAEPNFVWGREQRMVDFWFTEHGSRVVGYDSNGNVNFKDSESYGLVPRTFQRVKRTLGL
jgi:hypothetical protein